MVYSKAIGASVIKIAAGLPDGNYYHVAKFIQSVLQHPDTTYDDTIFIDSLKKVMSLGTDGYRVHIDSVGASGRNLELLIDSSYHIAIAQSDMVYFKLLYENPDAQLEVYVIADLFDEALHLIAPKNSPVNVKTVEKIVTLGKESGSYQTTWRIMASLGKKLDYYTQNSIQGVLKTVIDSASKNFAGALVVAPPVDPLQKHISKYRLISLTPEDMRVIFEKKQLKYLRRFTIQDKTHYKNLGEPVSTVSVSALLLVNKDAIKKLFGESSGNDDFYNRFIRYILTELYRFSTGKIGDAAASSSRLKAKNLVKDIVHRNTHISIVSNWDEFAREFWTKKLYIEVFSVLAIVFMMFFFFSASVSSDWKNLLVRRLGLLEFPENSGPIYLSRNFKGISINGRFINDFLGILTFLIAMVFLGFLFLYAGQKVHIEDTVHMVRLFIIGALLGAWSFRSLFEPDVESKFELTRPKISTLKSLLVPSTGVLFLSLSLLCYGLLKPVHLWKDCREWFLAIALITFLIKLGLSNFKTVWRWVRYFIVVTLVVLAIYGISGIEEIKSPIAFCSFVGGILLSLLLSCFYWKLRKKTSVLNEIWLLLLSLIAVWIWGSFFLFHVEQQQNVNFDNFIESLWSVVVYLFSGLEDRGPVTIAGRILASLVIFFGSIMVLSTFTAILSSFFTERRMKGGLVVMDYKDHVLIINWNDRGEKILREVIKSPLGDSNIVVLTRNPLPDVEQKYLKEINAEINPDKITFISGNPLNINMLRAVDVHKARAILVLAREEEGLDDPDAETAMILLSLKRVFEGVKKDRKDENESDGLKGKDKVKPTVVAEAEKVTSVELLKQAGADVVVSSEEFAGGLVVQSASYPGLHEVYYQLLRYSNDTNEFHMIEMKQLKEKNKEIYNKLKGRNFKEVVDTILKASPPDNPMIVVGLSVEVEGKDHFVKNLPEDVKIYISRIEKDGKTYEIYLNPPRKLWDDLKIPDDKKDQNTNKPKDEDVNRAENESVDEPDNKKADADKFNLIVMCYKYPYDDLKKLSLDEDKQDGENSISNKENFKPVKK